MSDEALEQAQRDFNLDDVVRALRGDHGSIRTVLTFTHGRCVQVYEKTRKIGPVIIPDRENGQTLGDVLAMLGDLVEGRREEEQDEQAG